MKRANVKERLLETAARLFYEQGYRATGINQILKEAEAAKASFYLHFPSKEALCTEYLERRHIISHERQRKFISEGSTVTERVCNLFENIRWNANRNNFNGCPFLNISSEINDHESALREVVTKHKTKLISLITEQLSGLNNHQVLAEMVYLIYEGANIAVKNYRETWPIDRGQQAVMELLRGTQK